MKNEILFCALDSYESLLICLKETFNLSRSRIKKSNLKNSFLNKAIMAKEQITLPIDLVNNGMINPEYCGENVEILFEDKDVLVLNKPSKVHCHPLSYLEQDNCLSFLRVNRAECLQVNQSNYDRGLLYRLDYETSGVLFYAKSDSYYQKVRHNFNEHAHQKRYFAIVEGDFDKEGSWTHYLRGVGKKGAKVAASDDPSLGEECSLNVKKLSYSEKHNVSLVDVELKTGYRHQIRTQLSFLGFPILGDVLYGGKSADRVYLHSYYYKILDYQVKAKPDLLFHRFFDFDGIL